MRARTFNMDETDNIVYRRPVIHLFILTTNKINQITHMCIIKLLHI